MSTAGEQGELLSFLFPVYQLLELKVQVLPRLMIPAVLFWTCFGSGGGLDLAEHVLARVELWSTQGSI